MREWLVGAIASILFHAQASEKQGAVGVGVPWGERLG